MPMLAHPSEYTPVCDAHERSKRYVRGKWQCPDCAGMPRARRLTGGGPNGWTSQFRDQCTRAGIRYRKALDAKVRVLCKDGVWLVPPPPDLAKK